MTMGAGMRIDGDWLAHPGTQGLLAMLEGSGHRALLVGGCVRNAVLGDPVGDVDIATDAWPTTVMQIAVMSGFRVIPTGVEHGTVTIVAGGRAHEVTTFRRDIDTDGRHATVAFAETVEEDAARRDFTMNALYADAAGVVIDPLDGLPDALARRVRFVGEAEARIREDYLRILRFFRFHAVIRAPEIAADGLAACAALAEGVDGLSRERVGAEMRKLLAATDPAPAVAAMRAAGVLRRVLPGADDRALAPLVHLEAGRPPRWLRRRAALGGEGDLRLSRAEAAALERLEAAADGGDPAALAWHHGAETAEDAILLRAARTGTPLPDSWEAEVAKGAAAVFPLTAADLMPGLQGPALGAALRAAETAWVASGFRLTREDLLARPS